MSPDDSDSIARYRNPDLWVQDLDPREMLALSALSGFLSDRIHNHKRLLTFQIHCLRWLVTQWQRIKIQELSCYSNIAQIETQVKVVSLVCVKILKLSLGWEHCFVRCPKHSPECRGAPYDWQTTHLCNMGSIFPKATTEKNKKNDGQKINKISTWFTPQIKFRWGHSPLQTVVYFFMMPRKLNKTSNNFDHSLPIKQLWISITRWNLTFDAPKRTP